MQPRAVDNAVFVGLSVGTGDPYSDRSPSSPTPEIPPHRSAAEKKAVTARRALIRNALLQRVVLYYSCRCFGRAIRLKNDARVQPKTICTRRASEQEGEINRTSYGRGPESPYVSVTRGTRVRRGIMTFVDSQIVSICLALFLLSCYELCSVCTGNATDGNRSAVGLQLDQRGRIRQVRRLYRAGSTARPKQSEPSGEFVAQKPEVEENRQEGT